MMSPKTRIAFKFIFGLGIWSFLMLGFFKLNGDPVTIRQFQQMPINGRLLLEKQSRWTMGEATSTTTDRYTSLASGDEVLVDNRAGKWNDSDLACLVRKNDLTTCNYVDLMNYYIYIEKLFNETVSHLILMSSSTSHLGFYVIKCGNGMKTDQLIEFLC